jgi:hypothetical protein
MSPFEKPKTSIEVLREALEEIEARREEIANLPEATRENELFRYRSIVDNSFRDAVKNESDYADEAKGLNEKARKILRGLE